MTVGPISAADSVGANASASQASFDAAVEQAQGGFSAAEEQIVMQGAAALGGMLLMPRLNEILGEVMSDE